MPSHSQKEVFYLFDRRNFSTAKCERKEEKSKESVPVGINYRNSKTCREFSQVSKSMTWKETKVVGGLLRQEIGIKAANSFDTVLTPHSADLSN